MLKRTKDQPARASNEALKGSWVVLARITSQVSQFLILLIAARSMTPADFGAFALLSALAVGLTRFSEAGWREYVMTVEEPAARAQTNTLALLCGLAAFAIGCVAAAGIWEFRPSATGALVMLLMGAWVIPTTLCATQAGVMVARGQLQLLSVVQIVGEIVGFGAALATFALDGGIYGLVAGKLGMQLTVLLLSIAVTRWFPLATLDMRTARDAISFSQRILVTRIVSFLQDNLSLFAIGAIVGPASAGLFRAAGRLAGSLFELVAEPVRLLAWSTFRGPDPGRAANRLIGLTIIIAAPLFVGLALCAENAVGLLLGREWTDAAPLLVAFAIAALFNSLNAITEPLLVMRGHIKVVPKLSIALTAINLAALVAAAPFGIFWIAVAQALVAIALLPVVLAVQSRLGGVSVRSIAGRCAPAFAGTAALVAGVFLARALEPGQLSNVTRLALDVAVGGLAYLAVVALLVPRHVWRLQDAPSGAATTGGPA